jgi:transcriptional regulator NrdR family protein
MKSVAVVKRDGSREPFSTAKIAKVVKAAGLTQKQTQELIREISLWLAGLNTSTITSIQIRDQIITLLQQIDPYVGNLFSWYQKTKEVK